MALRAVTCFQSGWSAADPRRGPRSGDQSVRTPL